MSDQAASDNSRVRLWLPAFSSAILLWMAFPPLQLWPLAWIAPIPWLRLIVCRELPGSRPYRVIYLAAYLHWLLMTQWVRLPHWLAAIGWLFLAAYLAAYVPAFVAISRIMVHRWRWPSICAAPIVWVGLELFRGYFLTGFSLLLLGHSQAHVPIAIQVADISGAYGVSFMVMMVAACMERMIPAADRPKAFAMPVAAAVIALATMIGYGYFRLAQTGRVDDTTLKVALIQGSFDTDFSGSEKSTHNAFVDYVRLTQKAAQDLPDADLVVWPESMFTANEPGISFEQPLQLIPDWDSLESLRARVTDSIRHTQDKARWVSVEAGSVPLLVGMSWNHLRGSEVDRYNAALLILPGGEIADRYDKMHPVMFGEYVPLANIIPWLEALSPMGPGLTAGRESKSIVVDGFRVAPNICFENTVPQLIRRQVRQLAAAGEDPDVLITITNDGWFWGSSLLDVHLACGIFRAVEMRRPLLIAANTGFSAHIDPHGRVVKRGPRRAEAVVGATVSKSALGSTYLAIGDSLPAICLIISLLAVVTAVITRWRTGPKHPHPNR